MARLHIRQHIRKAFHNLLNRTQKAKTTPVASSATSLINACSQGLTTAENAEAIIPPSNTARGTDFNEPSRQNGNRSAESRSDEANFNELFENHRQILTSISEYTEDLIDLYSPTSASVHRTAAKKEEAQELTGGFQSDAWFGEYSSLVSEKAHVSLARGDQPHTPENPQILRRKPSQEDLDRQFADRQSRYSGQYSMSGSWISDIETRETKSSVRRDGGHSEIFRADSDTLGAEANKFRIIPRQEDSNNRADPKRTSIELPGAQGSPLRTQKPDWPSTSLQSFQATWKIIIESGEALCESWEAFLAEREKERGEYEYDPLDAHAAFKTFASSLQQRLVESFKAERAVHKHDCCDYRDRSDRNSKNGRALQASHNSRILPPREIALSRPSPRRRTRGNRASAQWRYAPTGYIRTCESWPGCTKSNLCGC